MRFLIPNGNGTAKVIITDMFVKLSLIGFTLKPAFEKRERVQGLIYMKKLCLALGIIFGILTFIGAGYVLVNHGQVNAGYTVVPMVFAIAFLAMYKSKKEN